MTQTIPAAPGLLSEDSVVNVTQIATVDPLALEEHIGSCPTGWSPRSTPDFSKRWGCCGADVNSSPREGTNVGLEPPFDRDESSPRSLVAEEERFHTHVQSADGEPMFWIDPEIKLARNYPER